MKAGTHKFTIEAQLVLSQRALFHEIRAKTGNLMHEIQDAKEKLFHK